jgi:hypothetical protein
MQHGSGNRVVDKPSERHAAACREPAHQDRPCLGDILRDTIESNAATDWMRLETPV